jgi:hypothetical protein
VNIIGPNSSTIAHSYLSSREGHQPRISSLRRITTQIRNWRKVPIAVIVLRGSPFLSITKKEEI